jgi:hypothetical protein
VLNSLKGPGVPAIDPKVYSFHRLMEFLSSTSNLLSKQAQPGAAKSGRLEIVGCDWKLIDWFFTNQPCRKCIKTLHPTIDGKKNTCRRIKYEFCDGILPDLGCTNYWIRYHPPSAIWGKMPMRTFYKKLSFIIKTHSNIMWCQYTRCTQAFIFDTWIDQP